MTDRARLIESQIHIPTWQEQGIAQERWGNYANRYGTQEQSRLPQRRGFKPAFFFYNADRIQPQRKILNVRQSRYHGPSGLERNAIHDICNSKPKIEESEWMPQEITSNPGIINIFV